MISVSCLGSVYKQTLVSQCRTAIDSLLAGDCLPSEIGVVVDGPISASLACLLSSYSRAGFVRTVRLSANQGLARALNAGLAICSSEIVCRFDTDDINLPSRLSSICEAFEADPTLDILGSSIFEFTEESNSISVRLKKAALEHVVIINRLNYVNPLNHPSVAFRRSSICSIGGYRHMRFFEDYCLWLIARRCGLRFGNLEAPLVCMRRAGLLLRRSGLQYALDEAQFFCFSVKNGLISPLSVFAFALRCISRLMPGFLQQFQSYLPWRFSSSSDACPELLQWLAFEANSQLASEVGYPCWSSEHFGDM